MSATPTLVTNVKDSAVTLATADGTTTKTLLTADASWWTLVQFQATSDDTAARVLSIYKSVGGTEYLQGSISVPALAGTDAAVAVKNILIDPLICAPIFDQNGNKVWHIETGTILKVKVTTAVTTAKTITISTVALKS